MQTLYSVESMHRETSGDEPLKILKKEIEDTQALFTYLASFLTAIAAYAEKFAVKKAHKHLPSQSDLNVNTKIAGNTVVWGILENPTYKNAVSKFKTNYLIDEEQIRKHFIRVSESEEYALYIGAPSRNIKDERLILEFILQSEMIGDEDFMSEGDEKFIHWHDDMETVIGLMKGLLQKPEAVNFLEMPDRDKMDFAEDLLKTVLTRNDYCLELISPKLQNWEAERIAVIDMILLKMGVCEMLYFDTIPAKVSLNEYIDIAKEYSTEKSGHFVNGILDSVLRDLTAKDKIHKTKFSKVSSK